MGARCLTLHEAAEETGFSYKRVILPAVRAGELRAFVPFGLARKRYVRIEELRRFVRQQESGIPPMESRETDGMPR